VHAGSGPARIGGSRATRLRLRSREGRTLDLRFPPLFSFLALWPRRLMSLGVGVGLRACCEGFIVDAGIPPALAAARGGQMRDLRSCVANAPSGGSANIGFSSSVCGAKEGGGGGEAGEGR